MIFDKVELSHPLRTYRVELLKSISSEKPADMPPRGFFQGGIFVRNVVVHQEFS